MASRETPTRKLPIDRTGFMLLLIWVGALQVMLDTGKEADWFSSPAIVVELILAIIFVLGWPLWTQEVPLATLPLALGREEMVAGCAAWSLEGLSRGGGQLGLGCSGGASAMLICVVKAL